MSPRDRKSTRLNSSHVEISYAVFCLKKKKNLRYIIQQDEIPHFDIYLYLALSYHTFPAHPFSHRVVDALIFFPDPFFFFNDTATTEIYTLSLHDALPIRGHSGVQGGAEMGAYATALPGGKPRSEEHTSELQSRRDLVCRLLLEKKKN